MKRTTFDRWRFRFRRLRRIDPAALWELGRAQLELLRARAELSIRPKGKLLDLDSNPPLPEPDPVLIGRAERLSLALERAAENGLFRPSCLVRSLALRRLLNARGIVGSRIRIGVRNTGGEFQAHAWVEYGSVVLGDRAFHVERFVPLLESKQIHLPVVDEDLAP